ncbi:MAG: KilA-N domain-containing protein [Natronincolaceae bacterium]|nr:KilA-N domain-containing protein [Bacillota bacterium]NLK91297.1 KilA-N domain-containing protein [Clostridiales bacterium]
MSKKITKDKIYAKGFPIKIYTEDYQNEFISLTDIAKYKSDEPNDVIKNWLRNKDTLEFLGLWESLYNPNFDFVEFDGFRNQAGSNSFTMSPQKWIEGTNAIGIAYKSGSGRYSGIYAHSDIAFEFASWVSPEFKLYIIQGYKHLKIDGDGKSSLEWNLNREIVKINYRLQTEAIRKNLIAPKLTPTQAGSTYSSEADLLNVALFGKTAEQWKTENPDKKGSIRDYASADELLVLANLQSYNAILIGNGVEQSKRVLALNKFAQKQLGAIKI